MPSCATTVASSLDRLPAAFDMVGTLLVLSRCCRGVLQLDRSGSSPAQAQLVQRAMPELLTQVPGTWTHCSMQLTYHSPYLSARHTIMQELDSPYTQVPGTWGTPLLDAAHAPWPPPGPALPLPTPSERPDGARHVMRHHFTLEMSSAGIIPESTVFVHLLGPFTARHALTLLLQGLLLC